MVGARLEPLAPERVDACAALVVREPVLDEDRERVFWWGDIQLGAERGVLRERQLVGEDGRIGRDHGVDGGRREPLGQAHCIEGVGSARLGNLSLIVGPLLERQGAVDPRLVFVLGRGRGGWP